MLAKPFLRRRLAWFLTSLTPHGQDIPARLGPITIALALVLPVTAVLSDHLQQSMIFTLNLAMLLFAAACEVHAHGMFHEGMDTGRRELVAEMVSAWRESDLQPGEYIHREIWWESHEIRRARQTVRRSAKG
jgi:hypothetical protein